MQSPNPPDTGAESRHPRTDGGDERGLSARYRGCTPPDPDLDGDGWGITTICRRFRHESEETATCPGTGETISLCDQHLYVTAKRDPAPNQAGLTAQFRHYVLKDEAALDAWMGENSTRTEGVSER